MAGFAETETNVCVAIDGCTNKDDAVASSTDMLAPVYNEYSVKCDWTVDSVGSFYPLTLYCS